MGGKGKTDRARETVRLPSLPALWSSEPSHAILSLSEQLAKFGAAPTVSCWTPSGPRGLPKEERSARARAASLSLASVASQQAVRPGVIAARGEKSTGSVAIPIVQTRARQRVEVELLADNNRPEGMLNRQPLRKCEANKKANRPIG